jgi:hypothetical protein
VSSWLQFGTKATQISTGRQRQVPDGSYATRARQQVDCFQSRSHWQLPRGRCSAKKTQQLHLGKHRSEAAAGTTASVSNKTLHQSGKGTAVVQTAPARYTLIGPQERLWPFAKAGWTLVGLRVALVRNIQPWRPDR